MQQKAMPGGAGHARRRPRVHRRDRVRRGRERHVDYPPRTPAGMPLSVRICPSQAAGGAAAHPGGPGRRTVPGGPECASGMRKNIPPLGRPAFRGAARGPSSGVGG